VLGSDFGAASGTVRRWEGLLSRRGLLPLSCLVE